MKRLFLMAPLLGSLVLTGPPALALRVPTGTPLCRVRVVASPAKMPPQRVLTVTLRSGCHGVAYLRLSSKIGGTLPDNPPGYYTLRTGEQLRRVALPWWHLDWLKGTSAYPVPEERK